MQVDFGPNVTSLQDLQPTTPVSFQLNVETDLMGLSEPWPLPTEFIGNLYVAVHTLTESAVLFTNADAWVVIHGSTELDYFLQGYGLSQDLVAQVSVPSLGIRDVVVRLRADSSGVGKLRHEYTAAALAFQTNHSTGDIESVELTARRVGVDGITLTLTRVGASDTFISSSGQSSVFFWTPVQSTVDSGDPIEFSLTDPTLGLADESIHAQVSEYDPLTYETTDQLETTLPDGLTDPGYGAYWGWSFGVSAPPTVISQSDGGEIRVHYLRCTGPSTVWQEKDQEHPENLKLMPDGHYYVSKPDPTHPLACNDDCESPKAHVLLALSKVRPVRAFNSGWTPVLQTAGFVEGFGVQAWDNVIGFKEFIVGSVKLYLLSRALQHGVPTEQQMELLVEVNTQIENTCSFMSGCWDLWMMVEESHWDTLSAVASLDWEAANENSETMRWVGAYMIEFMVAVNNEYEELDDFERGKIQGRLSLEAVMIVLPFTKPAQVGHLSKVSFLEKLQLSETVQSNEQLLGIITRVIEVAKGRTPSPPIQGVPSTGVPPLLSGTELGGAGTRLSGAVAVEVMKQGTAQGVRRTKFVEEMLAQLPNAGERNLAARMKTYNDSIVDSWPDSPGVGPTVAQYDETLTYRDVTSVKTQKRVSHVLVDEEGAGVLERVDGSIPMDWIVAHHHPPRYVQEAFREFGFDIPDEHLDDVVTGLYTEFEHGKGGPASSIHNRLNALFPEELEPAELAQRFQSAEDMMDALIDERLGVGDNRGAKILRGWAVKLGIPFTK